MLFWVLRLTIIFAILTVIYIALSFYYRWDKKRELMAEYNSNPAENQKQEQYVADGLSNYDRSLKRKLLLGVYIVPVMIVLGLLFIANFM
ncbi:MAG: hypothetical protein V7776_18900 [Halopseudomonas aestusnigri]